MNPASTTICSSPDKSASCINLMSPPTSLLNLPPELHLLLFIFLDYESLVKLGASNKHFRSLVRREHVVAALYRDEDIIRDSSTIRNERLACFQCYNLRSAFFDFDKRSVQPKFTVTGAEAGRRRCLLCTMPSYPMEKVTNPKRGDRTPGTLDASQAKHQDPPRD